MVVRESATLGGRIRQVRDQLAMTQFEFAAELGVRPIMVSRWERDEYVPRLHRLAMIAVIGGLTLSELFEGVEATR